MSELPIRLMKITSEFKRKQLQKEHNFLISKFFLTNRKKTINWLKNLSISCINYMKYITCYFSHLYFQSTSDSFFSYTIIKVIISLHLKEILFASKLYPSKTRSYFFRTPTYRHTCQTTQWTFLNWISTSLTCMTISGGSEITLEEITRDLEGNHFEAKNIAILHYILKVFVLSFPKIMQ